jgi:hypothetical protein
MSTYKLPQILPIGRRLTLGSYFENNKSNQIFLLLLATAKIKYLHITFDKEWVGLHFGRFFHRHFWSPWSGSESTGVWLQI